MAAAFNDNGSGVRGDMKAVCQRDPARPRGAHAEHRRPELGKVREPVLRLSATACARSTPRRRAALLPASATPTTRRRRSNQTPMFSPTVFNFFRPGYVPPGKA